MNNNDILEKAKKSPLRGQEYENHNFINSTTIAMFVSLLAGYGMYITEFLIKGTHNLSLLALTCLSLGVQLFTEGIPSKKKRCIIFGTILTLSAVILIIFYIVGMV